MTIVSLKTENSSGSELNRIELSDGSLFSFRICYLPQEFLSGIAQGNVITAAQEQGFRFASECMRAEKAALRLIARAEQCSLGLTRKLKRRGYETACVSAVAARLCSLNLINDRRFAQLWIESRLRLSRTPRRLLSSLCGRGIEREDAQAALTAVLNEETELAMLTRYVKRHQLKTDKEGKERACSLKYLLKSEGFSPQAVNRFLNTDSI